MTSRDYVSEKMYNAVSSLCGQGTNERRLKYAALSLVSLMNTDVEGGLEESYRYVMQWTRENLDQGELKKIPDELEWNKLVEEMIHILLETDRESHQEQ